MKTFTLKKKDAYDLFLVFQSIVNQKAPEMMFADILKTQKFANSIKSSAQDFADAVEKIDEEKNGLIKAANLKIADYRATAMQKEFSEEVKKNIDTYVSEIYSDVHGAAQRDVQPKYDELYKALGDEDASIAIPEGSESIVTDSFEKYAKEFYNNKSRMVEVYEKIVSAA